MSDRLLRILCSTRVLEQERQDTRWLRRQAALHVALVDFATLAVPVYDAVRHADRDCLFRVPVPSPQPGRCHSSARQFGRPTRRNLTTDEYAGVDFGVVNRTANLQCVAETTPQSNDQAEAGRKEQLRTRGKGDINVVPMVSTVC